MNVISARICCYNIFIIATFAANLVHTFVNVVVTTSRILRRWHLYSQRDIQYKMFFCVILTLLRYFNFFFSENPRTGAPDCAALSFTLYTCKITI